MSGRARGTLLTSWMRSREGPGRAPDDQGVGGFGQTLRMPLTRIELLRDFGRACDLGNAALFVGAGLSMGAGLPSWGELLAEPLTRSNIPPTDDLPVAAEYIVAEGTYSRERLNQHILERVSGAGLQPTAALHHLVRLPVDQIWTTNYDPLIESTPQQDFRVFATDDDMRFIGTSERPIIKMHGSVTAGSASRWESDPVITRSDYERYENEHPRTWALLRATYLSKTMLFLGFSFSDPNIEVLQRLARLSQTAAADRHMAVLPRPEDDGTDKVRRHELRVRDLEQSGVRVLEITSFDDLTDILSDLVRRTRDARLFISGSRREDEEDATFEAACEALAVELAHRPEWELASLGGHAGWGVSRRVGRLRQAEDTYDPDHIVLHYRRREGQKPPDTLDERVGTAVFSNLEREPLVQGVLDESRAVVIIKGGTRTHEEILWATSFGAGVVPIATAGGTALEYWEAHKASPPALGGRPTSPAEWARLNSSDPTIAARACARLLDQAMFRSD